jgi:hypothetical protein
LSGGEIDLTFENAFFLHAIATQLQIQPLLVAATPFVSVPITMANAIPIIRNSGEHGLSMAPATQFIINNWRNFESSPDLLTLPIQSLRDIFDNEQLEPSSESVLFDLVCAIVRKQGREFVGLFQHVLFARLDHSQIKKFIELVSFDEVPECILEILDETFALDFEQPPDDPVPPPFQPLPTPPPFQAPRPRPFAPEYSVARPPPAPAPAPAPEVRPKTVSAFSAQTEFKFYDQYDEEEVINGVFAQFRRERPNDWANWIQLSGGGTKDKMLPHVLEYDQDLLYEFHWDNYDTKERIKASNAWLIVRLTSHRLQLTHYTIATSGKQHPYNSQPRSWRIEGSLDGKSWTLLAQVRRSDRFKDKRAALATFAVTERVRTAFSYFKLTQTENCAKPASSNAGEMRINALEFYGILFGPT